MFEILASPHHPFCSAVPFCPCVPYRFFLSKVTCSQYITLHSHSGTKSGERNEKKKKNGGKVPTRLSFLGGCSLVRVRNPHFLAFAISSAQMCIRGYGKLGSHTISRSVSSDETVPRQELYERAAGRRGTSTDIPLTYKAITRRDGCTPRKIYRRFMGIFIVSSTMCRREDRR